MLFEISDVLEQDIGGFVLLKDYNDFMEQSSTCVEVPTLETRLRKRLAWESRAKDVVRRHQAMVVLYVADDIVLGVGKVLYVQAT